MKYLLILLILLTSLNINARNRLDILITGSGILKSTPPNVPISKLSFRKELANVVEAFYQDFVATANNTLTSNNYEPL